MTKTTYPDQPLMMSSVLHKKELTVLTLMTLTSQLFQRNLASQSLQSEVKEDLKRRRRAQGRGETLRRVPCICRLTQTRSKFQLMLMKNPSGQLLRRDHAPRR